MEVSYRSEVRQCALWLQNYVGKDIEVDTPSHVVDGQAITRYKFDRISPGHEYGAVLTYNITGTDPDVLGAKPNSYAFLQSVVTLARQIREGRARIVEAVKAV
jgi:hypothetical protein